MVKLYLAFADGGGCCHLEPPIGVFSTFALARAALVSAQAASAPHPREVDVVEVDVVEVDLDVSYFERFHDGRLWPRIGRNSEGATELPDEPMAPADAST